MTIQLSWKCWLYSHLDEKTETVKFQEGWLRLLREQGFKQKSSFKVFTVFLNCITFSRKKEKRQHRNEKYRLVVFCLDGRKNFGQLESFNNERTTLNTMSSVSLRTFKLKLRDYIWRKCYRSDPYPWWIWDKKFSISFHVFRLF